MIKKTLSVLMAFSCIFSAETPIFADSDDEFLSPQYGKKHQILTKSLFNFVETKTAQKAFLIGLLCATGTNVEVTFRKNYITAETVFNVKKINNIDVDVTKSSDNEITALLDAATQNENFKFKLKNKGKTPTIVNAIINDYFLNQNVIRRMGGKILELIEENKPKICDFKHRNNLVSLTNNVVFMEGVSNILEDLLDNNSAENEIFVFPSNFKKIDPIINPDQANYLKQHPEASYRAIICYEKMFFIGLLSALGEKITVKIKETLDYDFPECIEFRKIDQLRVIPEGKNYIFLENINKHINSSFPPEKMKIETLPLSYLTPTKITINNKMILD